MRNKERNPIGREEIMGAVRPEELLELTEALIRIPSYPGIEGQETAAAEFLKETFCREGIEAWTEEAAPGRRNVYAILRGTGGGKSLLLNGHLDTVPPYDMEDALTPRLEGQKLYGRGTSDMKGPVAAMAAALIALRRLKVSPKGNLIFAGVIDEECRSFGTIRLLEQMRAEASPLRADAAIVGEPTSSQLCIGHRGLEWYQFRFIGRTVHGGHQAEGINAISKAVKFISVVERELIPKLAARNHPLLGSATLNIGVIRGGTQLSTVAGECVVELDRRFLPEECYEEVERELQEILDRLGAEDESFRCEMSVCDVSVMKSGYVHLPMETPADHPFVELVHRRLSETLEREAEISSFPAWTDGGLLSGYGKLPTVVYGPGYIELCHSKEEFIELGQLAEGLVTYALTALEYCSESSQDV